MCLLIDQEPTAKSAQRTDKSVGRARNSRFPITIISIQRVPCDGVFVVIFVKTMYNKTIIRFDFCDFLNNQDLAVGVISLGLQLGW